MADNSDTQERYNVFAELDQLYQQAHGRYMAAIASGNEQQMETCRAECERIEAEHTQAIALLRKHEVKKAYQHTARGTR